MPYDEVGNYYGEYNAEADAAETERLVNEQEEIEAKEEAEYYQIELEAQRLDRLYNEDEPYEGSDLLRLLKDEVEDPDTQYDPEYETDF
ncbi:MAG: hypothetical protein G01um101448_754 [Parcubacteria group bacterium Gr01-1014_48]|nr:MAG: hypothetical protein G01um101448_754 [Parcubacteria group bacterium Gr01-1014_48]